MTEKETPSLELDKYAGHTPLMRQYLTMREKVNAGLLLFRLGDFYETFFDDAKHINALLGLTLTHRGTFKGQPIPMAGIPVSTLDQYLARLVKLGQSVAICEQIGDPADAKNGMMERKLSRIVTPGTLTDSSLLTEKKNSTLLALHFSKAKSLPVGLTWLTLTNGVFKAAKIPAVELLGTLTRIAPSEVLVNESDKDKLLSLGFAGTLTELPDWHFDEQRGEETLKRRFEVSTLDAWNITHETELLASINALLGYVDQTQCDALPYIQPLELENESQFVSLDAATRRNLEITETLRGDTGPTLFSVLDHCSTSMGSRLLGTWLHHPLCDKERVLKRQAAVKELFEKNRELQKLKETLRGIPDIERMAGRIALKSIRPKEVAALRDAIALLRNLAHEARQLTSSYFLTQSAKLTIDEKLETYLKETLLEEPATFLREGDVIKSEASEELAALRTLRDNAGEYLKQLEIREKERTKITTLRVEYNHVSGYYIEVPKGQAQNVPVDYRRRQTLKNTERYITPELKEYEDKALSAKERASQLEKELWDTLLNELALYINAIEEAAGAVARLDVIASLACHAFESKWVAPELKNDSGLTIEKARHPVVEHVLEHYVPNDCIMHAKRRLLIITGPNMGGKSTYMRSIALITLLAYTGSFVPARSAKIGPVDKILTRIGASDDLARGQSTFMVEMTEAAAILHQATENSLVLMDEIGRGTSTFDGLSLAASIAQELAEKTKSWTLFATHYFELTALEQKLTSVVNVHVGAEETNRTIVFLHDMKDGAASQSYGIAVAKLAGIPTRVINRAKTILQTLEENAEASDQLDLFKNADADNRPTENETKIDPRLIDFIRGLKELDADALSPREALNLVYQIKDEAAKTLDDN